MRRKVQPASIRAANSKLVFHPISYTRQLVTFEPDSALWSDADAADPDVLKGAIVRLIPPASATDLLIEDRIALVTAMGVAAVKSLPRAAGSKLGATNASENKMSIDLRAEVLKVASRVRSADRAALVDELNSAMDKVGL